MTAHISGVKNANASLSPDELRRYSRHLSLPEVGLEGQERLARGSVLLGKPNVYGSVHRFEGQASVFCAPDGPCYRCLFREPPPAGSVPSCAEAGVLGVLPGLVGMVQATEAIKLLAGIGEPLVGRLLMVDALRMQFRTIELRRDPTCPACGTHEITALIDYDAFCGVAPHEPEVMESEAVIEQEPPTDPRQVRELSPASVAERLRADPAPVLLDVREPWEHTIAHIEGGWLVPLNTLPKVLDTLDESRETIVYCHHGIRSAMAVQFLQSRGFRNVWNLSGGIDAWSVGVDEGVRRY